MRVKEIGKPSGMKDLFLLIIGLSFMLITACSDKIDTAQKNQNLVESWFQVLNKGNLTVADEIFATSFVGHDPIGPKFMTFASYKAWIVENRTAFPDFHVEAHDMIAEGDKVASRWTVTGTHKGSFAGIAPTGVQVTVTGMSIHRLVAGRIEEAWWSYDILGMMQQLGVVSPTPNVPLPALNRKTEDYTWSSSSEVTGDPGDPETNKNLILREDLEGWKQGNVEVVLELIDPKFVNHDPIWPAVVDYESYKQWVETELDGPLNVTVDDLVAQGDKVMERCTVEMGGAIMESLMIIHRFADGRIVERWWSKDVLTPLQQMGMIRLPDQD